MQSSHVSLFIFFITLNAFCAHVTHHMFYWPIWPYIREKKGTNNAEGLIPDVMERILTYCGEATQNWSIHYYNAFQNYDSYMKFLQSTFKRGQGLLHNISSNVHTDYVWLGPFISPEIQVANESYAWVNKAFRLIESPGAHVIVQRSWLSWKYKLLRGVENSLNYLVLAVMMSFCIGAIVFCAESRFQNEFGQSLPEGVWNGFWWSTVTMTTIGYGDIVPRSHFGQFIGFFWLIFGIVMGSVITATVTDAMSSIQDLSISNREVGVLKHSWEARIAKEYEAQIIGYNTYDEVLEAVASGKTFAALINSDIVRWQQNEIKARKPALAIVYDIKIELPVMGNGEHVNFIIAVWDCLQRHKKDIFDSPKRKYYKHVQVNTVHYMSLKEMLIDDWVGLSLLIMSLIIIFISITCILVEKYKRPIRMQDLWNCLYQKQVNVIPGTPIFNGARRHSRTPISELQYENDSRETSKQEIELVYKNQHHTSDKEEDTLQLRVDQIENSLGELKKMMKTLIDR